MIDDTLLAYMTEMENKIAALSETLQWYADGRHMEYSYGHPSGAYLKVEQGDRARDCLTKMGVQ